MDVLFSPLGVEENPVKSIDLFCLLNEGQDECLNLMKTLNALDLIGIAILGVYAMYIKKHWPRDKAVKESLLFTRHPGFRLSGHFLSLLRPKNIALSKRCCESISLFRSMPLSNMLHYFAIL